MARSICLSAVGVNGPQTGLGLPGRHCAKDDRIASDLLVVTEWELLKIKELADLLQVNQETVRNMVNRGELEHVKLGRTRYIPRQAAVRLAGGTGWEIPELLTVAQVAKLLRLHEMTIRNWIDAGALPAVWIGERRVRIKRADLDALLERGRTVASHDGDTFWQGQPS